jgi:hypothetical protein
LLLLAVLLERIRAYGNFSRSEGLFTQVRKSFQFGRTEDSIPPLLTSAGYVPVFYREGVR